jgi:hypothetical protein
MKDSSKRQSGGALPQSKTQASLDYVANHTSFCVDQPLSLPLNNPGRFSPRERFSREAFRSKVSNYLLGKFCSFKTNPRLYGGT